MLQQATPAESPAPSPLPQRAQAAGQPLAPATPPPLTMLVVESPCIDVPALQARPDTSATICSGLWTRAVR